MPNVEARAMIELIIAELEETAAILKMVRDDHPVEAGRRLDARIGHCTPTPLVIVDPWPSPGPDPFPDCHEFLSLPPLAVLRATEQLMGAQVLAIGRLCELYDPSAGPAPS